MKEPGVIEKINAYIRKVPNSTIFYTMRQMKLMRITEQQIFAVKIFLALRHVVGLQIINTNLFLDFYGRTRANALQMLHELGDKGVLTLVRNQKAGPLRFLLSMQFNKLYTDEHQNRKV